MKDRTKFLIKLRRAGLFGWITGKITREDWDNIRKVIYDSRRNAKDGSEVDLAQEIAEDIVDVKKAEGAIAADTTVESIDFTSLLSYIDELLTQIVAFIKDLLALFDELKTN
jgi:hypothetical protein